jgi:hypothetical protein
MKTQGFHKNIVVFVKFRSVSYGCHKRHRNLAAKDETKVGFTVVSFCLVRKYCVIELYAAEFFGVNFVLYALKTKGFSGETEAFILNGDGENRTGTVRCTFSIDKSFGIPIE